MKLTISLYNKDLVEIKTVNAYVTWNAMKSYSSNMKVDSLAKLENNPKNLSDITKMWLVKLKVFRFSIKEILLTIPEDGLVSCSM